MRKDLIGHFNEEKVLNVDQIMTLKGCLMHFDASLNSAIKLRSKRSKRASRSVKVFPIHNLKWLTWDLTETFLAKLRESNDIEGVSF